MDVELGLRPRNEDGAGPVQGGPLGESIALGRPAPPVTLMTPWSDPAITVLPGCWIVV